MKKYGYIMQVNVIGTDDLGRTLVRCPARGCGETAYIADDGRLVCPVGEAEQAFMTRVLSKLEESWPFDT